MSSTKLELLLHSDPVFFRKKQESHKIVKLVEYQLISIQIFLLYVFIKEMLLFTLSWPFLRNNFLC